MSLFKFSSCLSCLSYFNFFSNCFKPSNNKDSEKLIPLLDKDKKGVSLDLSQHSSDKSIIPPYTLVEVSSDLNNSNNDQTVNQAEINLEQTDDNTLCSISNTSNSPRQLSLTLSSSSFSSITPRSISSGPIEISQSPESSVLSLFLSEINSNTSRVIFTKSPSQISREKDSNELSQNKTQLNNANFINYGMSLLLEVLKKRASNCELPEDLPSMSQDPRKLSIFQRVSSQIKCGLLDPLERKPGENSLRPGIKGGSPIAKCATMVPTSIAAEVAMRINAQETGQRVCHF